MSTDDIPLTVSWFSTATPPHGGPAIGDPERTTWGQFCGVFWWRREGAKDGPNFVPARFTLEADGRHVRRLKTNLVARTAIALDIEANKKTGELPPDPSEAVRRAEAKALACLLYTSHSHQPPDVIRYRMVFPLSEEIAPEFPAPVVMAEELGLGGVLDRSKVGASSLFSAARLHGCIAAICSLCSQAAECRTRAPLAAAIASRVLAIQRFDGLLHGSFALTYVPFWASVRFDQGASGEFRVDSQIPYKISRLIYSCQTRKNSSD